MISGILVATLRGDILLSRYFRNDLTHSMNQLFKIKVILRSDNEDLAPVNQFGPASFMHIKVEDFFVAAMTAENTNSLLVFEFLYKFVDILRSYFGEKLNSKKFQSHFVMIHEILEEIMDFGHPQITDVDTLKLYITQGKINPAKLMKEEKVKKITNTATGMTPWRSPDISYKKNELWIDVIEKINLLISHQGVILKSDVEGEIQLTSNLSGMPHCEFGMNDKLLVEKEKSKGKKATTDSIAFDDFSFHKCVKLSTFKNDRVVSFVPPDGVFTLMSYRATELLSLPYRIVSQVKYTTASHLEYEVTVASEYPTKLFGIKVTIKIPTPPDTAVCKINLKSHRTVGRPSMMLSRGLSCGR
uniref:MHD domain-containing protein n=1 Tax=Arcella intermedia TaxID=1963864 RepID=A0A6B2L8K6_9EUKA